MGNNYEEYLLVIDLHLVGEGICTGCEDKLFLPSYKQVEEVLYKKDKNGKYVEFQQTVYIMTEANPKCPDCGKAYDPEEFLDYDDREAIEYRNQSDSDEDSDNDDSD